MSEKTFSSNTSKADWRVHNVQEFYNYLIQKNHVLTLANFAVRFGRNCEIVLDNGVRGSFCGLAHSQKDKEGITFLEAPGTRNTEHFLEFICFTCVFLSWSSLWLWCILGEQWGLKWSWNFSMEIDLSKFWEGLKHHPLGMICLTDASS